MKKIAFFGASITQQKTGYVHHFKELNPSYNIQQFGYGSMYITDAGICFIDNVIDQKPDYCFLDWFSPACYRPPKKIKDYIDAIIEKLFKIECHPIFLFFYRKNMDNRWFEMFDYIKEYGKNLNINNIDLSKIKNPDQYLRDTIHTNDHGSEKYANLINKEFNKMIFLKSEKNITKNKYSEIKCLNINKVYTNEFQIKSDGESSIIGILQNIGPYTQDIECISDNQSFTKKIKDKWSERYERETIKIDIEKFSGNLKFIVPENSKLVVKKIFYIGDFLSQLSNP